MSRLIECNTLFFLCRFAYSIDSLCALSQTIVGVLCHPMNIHRHETNTHNIYILAEQEKKGIKKKENRIKFKTHPRRHIFVYIESDNESTEKHDNKIL